MVPINQKIIMKKILLSSLLISFGFAIKFFAQTEEISTDSSSTFLYSISSSSMVITSALRDLENQRAYADETKEHVVKII